MLNNITIFHIAEISANEVYSDVLERIDGYETFINDEGIKVYYTEKLARILANPEDDTNETTKQRLSDFYALIENCYMFIIK